MVLRLIMLAIIFTVSACQPRSTDSASSTKQLGGPIEAIKDYENFVARLPKIKEKIEVERQLNPSFADMLTSMFAHDEAHLKFCKQLAEAHLNGAETEELEAIAHAYIRVVEGSDSNIEQSESHPSYICLKSLINKK